MIYFSEKVGISPAPERMKLKKNLKKSVFSIFGDFFAK